MKTIKGKRLNFLLLLLTFIAGVVWWLAGELLILLALGGDSGLFQNIVFDGFYFSFLTLLMLAACFFSESRVHSIVNKDFFYMAVAVPSLKKVFAAAGIMMFLAAGLLEFIYAVEPVQKPAKPQRVTKPVETVRQTGFDDYYYAIDMSGSMNWADPKNERLKLLTRIVGDLPESKKIALITFDDVGEVLIPLQYADAETKQTVKQYADTLKLGTMPITGILNSLKTTASILGDDASRRGAVILITDGAGPDDNFDRTMEPFITNNVPVYTIMLGNADAGFKPGQRDFDQAIALLQRISNATGGRQFSVESYTGLEDVVVESMQEAEAFTMQAVTDNAEKAAPEPKRNLLLFRGGKRENSVIYGLMHILFVTALGFLMGYALCELFSHRDRYKPLITGGIISGLLAGIVLELGLQLHLPAILVRLLACVILSTVFWCIAFLHGIIARKIWGEIEFHFLDSPDIDQNGLHLYGRNSASAMLQGYDSETDMGAGRLESQSGKSHPVSGVLEARQEEPETKDGNGDDNDNS